MSTAPQPIAVETPVLEPPLVRHLAQRQVLQVLGVSRRKLWEWRLAGKFPPPVYLMGERNLMRWREDVVRAWMAENLKDAPSVPARRLRNRKQRRQDEARATA